MPEIPCGVSGIVLVFFGPKYPDFPAVFTVRRQRQANLGKSRAAPVVSVVSVASVASAADGLIARRAVVCGRSQSGRADNKKDRLQKRSFRLNDSGISRFGFVGRKPRPAVRPMAIFRGTRMRFARNPCPAPHCPDGRFPRCIAARPERRAYFVSLSFGLGSSFGAFFPWRLL